MICNIGYWNIMKNNVDILFEILQILNNKFQQMLKMSCKI
jgi:hypothetical protein